LLEIDQHGDVERENYAGENEGESEIRSQKIQN
jgi:hypothetical protein